MSPLMPQGDILKRRNDSGAHHTGKAGQVLGQDRVALVGHGAGTFLARREILFGFAHFGALEVTDLHRKPFDGAGNYAQRRKNIA